MKIAGLKTFVVGNPPPSFGGQYFIFVKLVTDDGIEGVGEVYGTAFGPKVMVAAIEDIYQRYVEGMDPFHIEKLWRLVYGSGYTLRPDVTAMSVLSAIEKSGLLSQAEKAGLTLTAIEQSGLLSTAERLGLLEVAERALVTDPGKITALSIAPLVTLILTLSVFPDDNTVLAVAKYSIAAVAGGVFLTLFAGSYVIASLQE